MDEDPGNGAADVGAEPRARLRARNWLSWVWLAPIFAAAVVLWLAWGALAERGPMITIAFQSAAGLQAGQTSIQYRGVEVGRVERIELSRDMSRILVSARMTRAVKPYLARGARFWIVEPRVGAQGISGLTTLVSGEYIEMYPGHGAAQRQFVGLEAPPLLQPDTPGRAFTLTASNLASLSPGAPLSYRGIRVGQIEGAALDSSGTVINIYVFVAAPYDRLVHPQTRFWNQGGIDVSAGAEGIHVRVGSWEQLLAGGIEFDTPAWATDEPASAAGSRFALYDSASSAARFPHGTPLVYHVNFSGNTRGVGPGTPVELEGTEVGQVTQAHLVYDEAGQALYTASVIAIDPSILQIAPSAASDAASESASAADGRVIRALVAHGLRARLLTSSFLTGQKIIALDMMSGVPPAQIREVAGNVELPSAPGADLDSILENLQNSVRHIDQATAGPELGHSLKALDATLTHLERMTADLQPQTQALIESLRTTAEAAQRTATAAGALLGANPRANVDLPALMQQLNSAARSVRDLADYLDRHPEALLRGRR
jgi:paraquat-inducible protein B